MSELSTWQEGNDKYLKTALSWLRLRLERFGQKNSATTVVPFSLPLDQAKQEEKYRPQRINGTEKPSAETFHKSSPESISALPTPAPIEEKLTEAAAAMQLAEQLDPPPALIILGQRFGLTRFEIELLLLCAAPELDTGIPALYARAQGDPNSTYPTFSLAFTLFDDPAWDALSPERQLRYWKMLEIDQSIGQPLISCPLRLDQRIVDYIKGLNYLDSLLAPIMSPLDMTSAETQLSPSQQAVAERIASYLKQFSGSQSLPVTQLLGPDERSKQSIALQASRGLGLHLYRMPSDLLPAKAVDLDELVRVWGRESFLLPVSLYLDAVEAGNASEGHASLNRFLARSEGLFFLDARDLWPGLSSSLAFDMLKPTPLEQESAWAAALGSKTGESPGLLAGQFNLDLDIIKRITANVLAEKDDQSSLHEQLWESCLINTRPQLDILAKRLDPKAAWEDIVLPAAETHLLRQIASQVRNRRKVYDDGGFRQRMN